MINFFYTINLNFHILIHEYILRKKTEVCNEMLRFGVIKLCVLACRSIWDFVNNFTLLVSGPVYFVMWTQTIVKGCKVTC